MTSEDPTLPTKWLCAAFALAMLFALGNAGCTTPPPDDELEIETEGGELPEEDDTVAEGDRIGDDDTDLLGRYDSHRHRYAPR